MFRFSIRELFLLTLVVGLCVGWWLDHSRLIRQAAKDLKVAEEAAAIEYFELAHRLDVVREKVRQVRMDLFTGWGVSGTKLDFEPFTDEQSAS